MAREFIYFLMNLDCPRTIYKEFIIRYFWTKNFYQYIFQNAVNSIHTYIYINIIIPIPFNVAI